MRDDCFSLKFAKKSKVFPVPRLGVPMADTHAHLLSFWDKEPVGVLVHAAAAGVAQMTTIWDPLSDAEKAPTADAYRKLLEGWLAEAREVFAEGVEAGAVDSARATPELFDNVRYLVGVHPYGAPDYTEAVHERVVEALDCPLCIGIGEIGLDYHFDTADDIDPAPHDVQIEVMARQLALACERDVPVELHLRNEAADAARTAHADAYRVLRQVGVPRAGCVLHCFGEDRATMERFVELGCHIAYGGAATFKRNDAVREAFAATPRDRLLFETDCPYMAPEPIRGLECEPAMMGFTVEALTQGDEGIQRAAWENARRLFG